jgi:hypothetical protein
MFQQQKLDESITAYKEALRNNPNDEQALGKLQECFPDRRIVGIDSTELVWGLGSFHCLTQQVPRGRQLSVS